MGSPNGERLNSTAFTNSEQVMASYLLERVISGLVSDLEVEAAWGQEVNRRDALLASSSVAVAS
jgi:hypothetical protein